MSVSRQVFCYIDYLGALIKNGKNSSNNAIAYMNEYLTKINSKYNGKTYIMYNMWRHGTVHKYNPKIFKSSNEGFRLGWGANNSSKEENRKWHLSCFCVLKKPHLYDFFINLFELVEDLKNSIRLLIRELEFDYSFLQATRNNHNKMTQDQEIDSNSDLLTEAKNIIENSVGIIGEKGRVIRIFKDKTEFYKFRDKEWK